MSSTTFQMNTQTKAGQCSKDVAWYFKEFPELSPAGRDLFENYSHIPPDKIESHVLEIVRPTPPQRSPAKLTRT